MNIKQTSGISKQYMVRSQFRLFFHDDNSFLIGKVKLLFAENFIASLGTVHLKAGATWVLESFRIITDLCSWGRTGRRLHMCPNRWKRSSFFSFLVLNDVKDGMGHQVSIIFLFRPFFIRTTES